MSTDSAVSTPWLVALIVGVWLLVFPLFWLGVTGLLSIVGGWRELSASYAMDPAAWKTMPAQTTTGALQRFLLPVNYSHTLRVHVRDDGFALAPVRVFRFMHPPLFIPWTAVRECQDRTLLFWRYVEVTVHGSSVSIMVGGRPGRAMLEAWMGARVSTPGVPAVMYGR
jgi:hypothetical protein